MVPPLHLLNFPLPERVYKTPRFPKYHHSQKMSSRKRCISTESVDSLGPDDVPPPPPPKKAKLIRNRRADKQKMERCGLSLKKEANPCKKVSETKLNHAKLQKSQIELMKITLQFQGADLTWKPEFYVANSEWRCVPRDRYLKIFTMLKYGKYADYNKKDLDNAEKSAAQKIQHWEAKEAEKK